MKAWPNMAKQTDGAIGYVEYAYAKQNNLTYTKLVNKDGKTVEPSLRGLPGRRRRAPIGPMPRTTT